VIEECHADGLRWDAITYIRNIEGGTKIHPMTFQRLELDAVDQERSSNASRQITIAEGMHGNAWVTKDVGAGGAASCAMG